LNICVHLHLAWAKVACGDTCCLRLLRYSDLLYIITGSV
jgi:hypothetical protein